MRQRCLCLSICRSRLLNPIPIPTPLNRDWSVIMFPLTQLPRLSANGNMNDHIIWPKNPSELIEILTL